MFRLRRSHSGSEGWWDAVGGIHVRQNITDKLYLTFLGDAGGGSSEISWQVLGGFGYQFSEQFYATLAYRYLDYDYAAGGFTYDVETQGFVLGLGYKG